MAQIRARMRRERHPRLENFLFMKAKNKNEERVLAHFLAHSTHEQQLAAKAAGRTPAGAMKYAAGKARKLPRAGSCVCVDDETVYAWTTDYFLGRSDEKGTDKNVRSPMGSDEKGTGRNVRSPMGGGVSPAARDESLIQLELFGEGAA